mmetsp:Transcript_39748/g.63771  ORF Transcript_39748/g.63771 Transcript_39748/m.63771 type:complete len:540 (-) Transcript_39748:116-1735(-)
MGAGLPYPLMSKSLARTATYNGSLCVGSAEMQGWRLSMEDEIHIRLDLCPDLPGTSLFGVYDGHNGSHCSAFLRKQMGTAIAELKDPHDPKALTKALERLDARFVDPKSSFQSESGSTAVVAIIDHSQVGFTGGQHHSTASAGVGNTSSDYYSSGKDGSMQQQQQQHKRGSQSWSPKSPNAANISGTTTTTTHVKKKKNNNNNNNKNPEREEEEEHDDDDDDSNSPSFRITIANVGDSKALLVRSSGECQELTIDHKPTRDIEQLRIVKAGGYVFKDRVNGDLAVSRAFGDLRHKKNKEKRLTEQSVVATPEVSSFLAKHGDFLVLACDGVFERLTPQQVGAFVHDESRSTLGPGKPDLIAARLIDYSLYRGSKDNMSCLIVSFLDPGRRRRRKRTRRRIVVDDQQQQQQQQDEEEEEEKKALPPQGLRHIGMRYMAGRYRDWKEHEKFEKAYSTYAYSCGISGNQVLDLSPPISIYLGRLNELRVFGHENPFGIAMIICDYLHDSHSYMVKVDESKALKHRNHIDTEALRIGSCCALQ